MSFDELDEIAPALAALQGELPVIPNTEKARIRTNSGEGYAYSYADLGTIMPIIAPLLAKHGLAFVCLPTRRDDGAALLVGMLVHTSGQRLTGELPITGRTPQEIGSSLTYGRRYLLCCLTGVVTDDDDDGQLAQRAAQVRGGLETARGTTGNAPLPPPQRQRAQRRSETTTELPERSGPNEPLNTTSRLAKAMYAALRDAGIDGPGSHDLMSEITGRDITSSKQLTNAEARRVLDFLPQHAPVAPEPED